MSCPECERRALAHRMRQRKVVERQRKGTDKCTDKCCGNCGMPGHYAPTCPVPLRGEP